ncbi:hypothetical protein [Sporosarcina highlanderae]|uniref:Uncharacterized protein n=1 Tax=Sporosarcina highlanderae TaxID=3035916 RepID=A0ABT8JTH0_9BACL|nr:hypothetical protein [Sporosarcina highlanderae]MDN4608463.1 hypothetical protein [Sporosarcina highlanderae]
MKSKLAAAAAILYFIFPMSIVLIILIFTPIMFLSDVSTIRTAGFAGPQTGIAMIGICGLFIGISMLVPALRRMYRAIPWLYAFITIFFINVIIANTALMILNKGYEVTNSTRHTIFLILMIVFIIGARLAMSIYFKKRPVTSVEVR